MPSFPTLQRIAALIFDLDGTLVNSFDDIALALNLTRVDYGLTPLPREEVIRRVGDGSDALVRACVPVDKAGFAEAYGVYLRHYNAHLLNRTRLNPGVEHVLEHFAGRHLAVVTNKLEKESRHILEGLDILGRFALVMGGDTLSAKKPDPIQINHVIETFGIVPEQCVMIGDGINDIRAGRAAGVATVAYLGGVDSSEALAAESPTLLIDDMAELIRLVV